MCVSFDPVENLYKCWYVDYAWDYDRYVNRDGAHYGLIAPGWFDTTSGKWLYAESKDGLNWDKPELDVCDIDGQKTNVCLDGQGEGQMYVGSIFLDPLEKDQDNQFQ